MDTFCSLLPETCDTEVSQEGFLILFLFIYYFSFSARQLPPVSVMLYSVDVTWGQHCLSQRNQPAALGHAKSPTGC